MAGFASGRLMLTRSAVDGVVGRRQNLPGLWAVGSPGARCRVYHQTTLKEPSRTCEGEKEGNA